MHDGCLGEYIVVDSPVLFFTEQCVVGVRTEDSAMFLSVSLVMGYVLSRF